MDLRNMIIIVAIVGLLMYGTVNGYIGKATALLPNSGPFGAVKERFRYNPIKQIWKIIAIILCSAGDIIIGIFVLVAVVFFAILEFFAWIVLHFKRKTLY